MVDEIKNVNSVSAAQSSGTEFAAGRADNKKILIFEEFKKYAAAHGIELTPETEASMQAEESALRLLDIIKEILGLKKTEPTANPAEAETTEGTPVDEDMQNFFMAASTALTEEPVSEEVSPAVTEVFAQEPKTVVQEPLAEFVEQEAVQPEPEVDVQPEVTEPVTEEVAADAAQIDAENLKTTQLQPMELVHELKSVGFAAFDTEANISQEVENQADVSQEAYDELDFGVEDFRTQTTAEEHGADIDGQNVEVTRDTDFRKYVSVADLDKKSQDEIEMILVRAAERNEYIFAGDPEEEESCARAIEWDNNLSKEWDVKWANYTDEERNELIAKYIDTSKTNDYNLMLINAATDQCSTVSNYIKYKDETVLRGDTLLALATMKGQGYELSDYQKNMLEEANLKVEIVKQTLIERGYTDVAKYEDVIRLDNVDSIINGTNTEYNEKIDYDALLKSYVEDPKNDAKLMEIFSGNTEKVANLKRDVELHAKLPNDGQIAEETSVEGTDNNKETAKKTACKGCRSGEKTKLEKEYEKELKEKNPAEYAKYRKANAEERLNMRIEYLKKRYEDGELSYKDLKDYIEDCWETSTDDEDDEIKALIALYPDLNEQDKESIKTTDSEAVMDASVNNIHVFGKDARDVHNNAVRKTEDAEKRNKMSKAAANSCSDEQAHLIAAAYADCEDILSDDTIQYGIRNFELRKGADARAVQEQIYRMNDAHVAYSVYIAATELGDRPEAQQIYFNGGVNGRAAVAEQAIQWVKDLLPENQESGYKAIYQVAVNTNNTAMLDNLNGQYSQLSPEAQAAIASNPQYAASLSASAARAMAAEDDALRDNFSIQSNAAFDNVKTHKEMFMEQWDKLTPAQKYNVICDMSVRNFSKMSPSIRKKILEHAKNDPLFLHRLVEKFGMDLLKNELFPDALSVIVRDLLRDPSQRRIVAQEVFNNPSRYPAQLVEDCQDILRDYADNIRPEVFNRLSGTEKVEALKNPDDFEVPEDIDYGEDLTYAPSQSGSNRRNKLEYDKWNSLKTIANFYRIS